ncbi:hypothetical protein [Streptomyces abikoensis]|uniref:hypothetical protein n=1 Tax=Streptomyces abikoensis TaxID=97398 RepID=UPI001678F136|nr:hypothetical protein [Streptomyces abikoensis]GGP55785.1 hypothetical protein GCM10010214_31220 [Streptomyces abikoensis]
MNLLALRKLIGNVLGTKIHGVDNHDVRAIQYLNPPAADGPWALRVTVTDGVGGSRTFRLDITEE